MNVRVTNVKVGVHAGVQGGTGKRRDGRYPRTYRDTYSSTMRRNIRVTAEGVPTSEGGRNDREWYAERGTGEMGEMDGSGF